MSKNLIKEQKEKFLSKDDLCAIIRQCAKSSVKSFDIEGVLSIQFLEEDSEKEKTTQNVQQEIIPLVAEEEIQKTNEEYVGERELDMKEDELAILHVEDPLAYEDLNSIGDINEEGTDAENDSPT